MTLHVYAEMEQRSDEWYAARCGIVTASSVGKLITSRTIKPASNDESRGLVALLASERVTGYVEPTYASSDMFRGIMAEPFARDLYSGHHAAVVECGFMTREFPMSWDPNELAQPVDEPPRTFKIGYSPDGLVGDDGLIEVKAPRQKGHLATVVADEVPAFHMAQLQAGLLVSGRGWVDFISYCGGMPLWVRRVTPDPRWQAAILQAVEQAEKAIAETVATYQRAVVGLPVTERIDYEAVELKL